MSNLILTQPFTVWVLSTFVRGLPKELEEAAVVDGASGRDIVRRVFMPLVDWNEFLSALTLTLSSEQRTVPAAIALITGASDKEPPWGDLMAASVIVTVPLIVLVSIFQREVVAVPTAGAVKG